VSDPDSKRIGDPDRVGDYYDQQIYDAELSRLTKYSPIEYRITARYLERMIPAGALVADIGVGGGDYSELLARRGCRVHLVDVSQRLLDHVVDRLADAGLFGQIAAIHHISATALAAFDDQVLDAALMLGPFYHLTSPHERARAAMEAHRVVRPGGILFAAGINRLAFLRDTFRLLPDLAGAHSAFVSDVASGWYGRYLHDGNLDPVHAPPIGLAHFTTVEEFRALFHGLFEEVALAGTESFAAVWQDKLASWGPSEEEAWLDIIEKTGRTPEGLGAADHFLFIGRRV
jgi:SAM-dependent methyltransferase